jgi:outer membrane protein assembly factor BamB
MKYVMAHMRTLAVGVALSLATASCDDGSEGFCVGNLSSSECSDAQATSTDAGDAGVTDGSDGASVVEAGADGNADSAPGPDATGACSKRTATGTTAVAFQINPQHTGIQSGDVLSLPLCQRWTAKFPGSVSYPLVADGRVFVTVAMGGASGLYALDEQTGNALWGPITVGSGYPWGNAAYDGGRVFAINSSGVLSAFDAATGTLAWSVTLTGQYAFSSPPTALEGTVYLSGSGASSDGTLYAVDESAGNVNWTANVQGGDESSAAVSSTGVFVSYACNQAYAFDPATGNSLWHHSGSCSPGGGKTTALFGGNVYTRDIHGDLVLSADSGSQVGTFMATAIPAFSASQTFRLNSGTLSAVSLTTGSTNWTFGADGSLGTAPLVVGSNVVVGGGNGTVYVLDAQTGHVVSSAQVGAQIPAPNEQTLAQPLTGMAEADGVLLVPAGSILVAY